MATERPSEYQRSYPVAPVIPVPGTMVLIDDICRPGNGIECYIPNIPACDTSGTGLPFRPDGASQRA